MILIVGLGNPGRKFQKTRHNVGFLIIENLKLESKKISSSPPSLSRSVIENFPDWRYEKKYQAEISQGKINNQKVILAKPQIFMNNSGKSVKPLINFYKITSPGLVVIHDDIDLPLGKIKIVKNRGAAGHKGVGSIIKELKTKSFVRFRIGIKPKLHTLTPKTLDKFVLQKFNKDEERIVKEVIKKSTEAIEIVLKEGLEKAMSKYNK